MTLESPGFFYIFFSLVEEIDLPTSYLAPCKKLAAHLPTGTLFTQLTYVIDVSFGNFVFRNLHNFVI
jgi:hypothetical protein